MKKKRINERIREKLDEMEDLQVRDLLYDVFWQEYLNRGAKTWQYRKKYEYLVDKHTADPEGS